MHLSRALSALLAASVLSACASSAAAPGRKSTPTPVQSPYPLSTAAPPLSDAQIARRGLLRRGDFPKDWKVTSSAADKITCKSTTAAHRAASGKARGKAFTSGPNTEAESVVYVYRSEKVAKRQTGKLGGSATTSCIARALKRAFAVSDYKIGAVTTVPLDLGDAGDERLGTRITIPVSHAGVDADVLVDVVVVRVGRAFALELFVDAFQAFDEGFRAKLTGTQVQRLRAAQQS